MKRLKINSDVGEGVVNEAALMPYLKSCSIACGGHYIAKKNAGKNEPTKPESAIHFQSSFLISFNLL